MASSERIGAGSRTAKDTLRKALLKAVSVEESGAPFELSGRGHEPRVTLDRQLAAILRSIDLPRVHISGFGANNFYPRRVFQTAQLIIGDGQEQPRICFYGDSVYVELPE